MDVSPLPGCHRVASEGLGLGIPGFMSPWWSLESWEGGGHTQWIPSLKLTAKAPENGWLEYFLVSFWEFAYFWGVFPMGFWFGPVLQGLFSIENP